MGIVLPMRRQPDSAISAPQARAIDDLAFIRNAMENASSFTAVPGLGGMLIGGSALLAAFSAHLSRSPLAWLAIWSGQAVLALAIALGFSYRKAARTGSVLLSKPFRRFVLAILPSVFVGAILTSVLHRDGSDRLLPAVWLLLYGAGVSSAGAFSVRIVPLMGMSFLAVGTVAALAPRTWADPLMAFGFGGLHLAFGFVIARRYGG